MVDMETILLTGGTGFVGSALSANFLAAGARVIVVSRADDDGARTRSAVRRAAGGVGIELTSEQWARLDVVSVDFADLRSTLSSSVLQDVTAVWHCAAEMSYSSRKLVEAFTMNVTATATLYDLVAKHSPRCRRFYVVSTAFTAGIEGRLIKEEMHLSPRCINTYQVTKWAAELTLAQLHGTSRVPVTLFRPSVVIGHHRTGWSSGTGFGIYQFIDAINAGAEAGAHIVTLDVEPSATVDLVTIDTVTHAAVALTFRNSGGDGFEIFHCAGGGRMTTGEVMSAIGEAVGVRLAFAPPITEVDRRLNRAIQGNRVFASTTFEFDRMNLTTELGEEYMNAPLDASIFKRIVRTYLDMGGSGVDTRVSAAAS